MKKLKNEEYRRSVQDPTIIEDELGNPVFKYLGIWPQDLEELVANLNNTGPLRSEIKELKAILEYYER